MSQHSFSIANEAGAAFRSDVNAALQALASGSRGATAPTTTYIGMYWEDTTASLLKRRNAADSGWIVVASLDETFVVSRASNTILGISDYGKTFVATGSFTQTLTAAATLGDGWHCFYRNDGSGVITLDPNASETIDGATTIDLQAGEGIRIACTGSAFKTTAARSGQIKFPATQNPSADVNTLDDYEEGTWTPSVGGTSTYNQRGGTYTKIGRLVYINGYMSINAIGTGNTSTIFGLPFTCSAEILGSSLAVTDTGNLSVTPVSIGGRVNQSGTTIAFPFRTAASASDAIGAMFQNGSSINFSGCYQV